MSDKVYLNRFWNAVDMIVNSCLMQITFDILKTKESTKP